MIRRGLVPALTAAVVAASSGCGALLDLDVQSIGAGGDGGLSATEAGPDATTSDGPEDAGSPTPPPDASDGAGALVEAPFDAAAPPPDTGPIADGSDDSPSTPDVSTHPDAPVTPGMINLVQQNATVGLSDAGTTIAITFATPVTAHDTLVIGVDATSLGSVSATDSRGNTYTLATKTADGGQAAAILYALDVTGGSDTVTLTVGNNVDAEIYAHEYSGIGSFVGGSSMMGTGTAMSSGVVPNAAVGDLLFGYGVAGAVQAGAGFTTRLTLNANLTEDMIVQNPAMAQALASSTGGFDWLCLAAAFRPR
jgi:hypothetical protein